MLYRAKIVRGGHCTCRKDVHFRRRLLYCYEEIKSSQDDRSRISSDSRLSTGKVYSSPGSEDKTRLRQQRERVAQRIAAVSESAKTALAVSAKKLARPTSSSKKIAASSPSSANITPQLSRAHSPERDNLNVSFSFTPKKNLNESLDESLLPRTMGTLNRSGQRDLANTRHSTVSSIGDNKSNLLSLDTTVSHWDLAHIEADPKSLEKYRNMSLAALRK